MIEERIPAREGGARGASAAEPASQAGLSTRTVLIFAVACGLVVANLYYAQPVLNTLAQQLHTSVASAGLIVTLTQAGYALGLLVIVPLGDLVSRRRLIVTVLALTTLALVGTALAPTIGVLALISFAVGITSVVVQVLIPFAADLAPPARRGRVVGTVMSGLLIGALLARTISGLITQVAGWRAVYWISAGFMLLLIVVLSRELPAERRRPSSLTYKQLLRSVVTIARKEPVLRRRAAYGSLCFAAFSVLWTTVAFMLARPPYGFGEAAIGLFGLVGVAGALCASVAGQLADRGWSRATTGAFLAITALSFALLAAGGHTIIALIAGMLLLDLGVQGAQITNQSEIYRLRPEARSRVTTVYMVAYFIGGAVGSATAGIVFGIAGWPGVCLLGAGFGAVAFAFWLTELRRPRHVARVVPPRGDRAISSVR